MTGHTDSKVFDLGKASPNAGFDSSYVVPFVSSSGTTSSHAISLRSLSINWITSALRTGVANILTNGIGTHLINDFAGLIKFLELQCNTLRHG